MGLSIQDIENQGNGWISEILTSNGMNVENDDALNILNAARLVRQAGQLNQEDSIILDNPMLYQLLKMNKVQLAQQIMNNNFAPTNAVFSNKETASISADGKSSYKDFKKSSSLQHKPDVFAMAETKHQMYYKKLYILPYVGYRFLKASGCRYENYVVLSVGKKIGAIVKSATVSRCSMDGLTLIGEPTSIEFDKSLKSWRFKNSMNYLYEGIASDEGFRVSSYDDPLNDIITHFELDKNNIPILKINLIANIGVRLYSTSSTARYIVSKIDSDRATFSRLQSDYKLEDLDEKYIAKRGEKGWEIIPPENVLERYSKDVSPDYMSTSFSIKIGECYEPKFSYPT